MSLDIRLPIGLMFAIIGFLLTAYGLMTAGNAELYARSGGTNVNLYWGIILFIFGGLMTFFGRRAAARNQVGGVRETFDSPEGIATERREKDLGLEDNSPDKEQENL